MANHGRRRPGGHITGERSPARRRRTAARLLGTAFSRHRKRGHIAASGRRFRRSVSRGRRTCYGSPPPFTAHPAHTAEAIRLCWREGTEFCWVLSRLHKVHTWTNISFVCLSWCASREPQSISWDLLSLVFVTFYVPREPAKKGSTSASPRRPPSAL